MADPKPPAAGIREDQMPACPLMRMAWIGCVRWAISEPEIMARFRADTGNSWEPSANGLEAMIDAATGADVGFMSAFIDWHNTNIWGDLSHEAFSSFDALNDEEASNV